MRFLYICVQDKQLKTVSFDALKLILEKTTMESFLKNVR